MKFGENKLSEAKATLECPDPAAEQLEQHLKKLDDYVTESTVTTLVFMVSILKLPTCQWQNSKYSHRKS